MTTKVELDHDLVVRVCAVLEAIGSSGCLSLAEQVREEAGKTSRRGDVAARPTTFTRTGSRAIRASDKLAA